MLIASVSLDVIVLTPGLSHFIRRVISLITERRAQLVIVHLRSVRRPEAMKVSHWVPPRASHLYTTILNHVPRCDRLSGRVG